MSEYDSPWKEAVDVYFEPFIAFFFPQIYADVDWSKGYEFLDKELQKIIPQAQIGPRAVDKLVKVWRKNGQEEWVLIHIEIQSQPQHQFPERLYIYNYRIFDRYNKMVVSLAILGDDRSDWRPSEFERSLWGCKVCFQFPVVKLLDYIKSEEELEKHENPFAVIVLAHLKSIETRRQPDDRYAWKLRLIRGLFDRGFSAEDIRQLFRFIDWMMDLPEPLVEGLWQEIAQIQENKSMPFISTPERVGLRRGLLEGIEATLEVKFGEEGLKLMPEVHEVYGHEKLSAILKAIKTANSPDELRPLWTEDSSQGPIS